MPFSLGGQGARAVLGLGVGAVVSAARVTGPSSTGGIGDSANDVLGPTSGTIQCLPGEVGAFLGVVTLEHQGLNAPVLTANRAALTAATFMSGDRAETEGGQQAGDHGQGGDDLDRRHAASPASTS